MPAAGPPCAACNPKRRPQFRRCGLLSCRPNNEENSMRKLLTFLALIATVALGSCGYNTMQRQDEQVKAAWSEVLNQYQRRADLVPNLVNTVKGFAAQEQKVLLGVTEARAKVGSIQATPELVNDPQALSRFLQAQG